MDKTVSIIIPVYNVEKYLNRCMESIVKQTYADLQIILVDDGSKDKSGAMCDAWERKDSRITVIHQKNGGLSNARNTGMKHAKGEYLIFVDSDDVAAPEMTEQLIGLIEAEDADISICGVSHIFDENNIRFEKNQTETMSYDRNSAIKEMWYQKSFLPSAWGKAYKKSLFENLGFTEGILFEDIDIMHELFWRSNKIVYKNQALYGYVHREDSITTAKFSERDCDILKIAEKILKFAKKNNEALIPAAEAYAVTAAFRIYLNVPVENTKFKSYRIRAEELLCKYGKTVLKDKKVRNKTKYALILYFYCRPFLTMVYKHKNRWK